MINKYTLFIQTTGVPRKIGVYWIIGLMKIKNFGPLGGIQ